MIGLVAAMSVVPSAAVDNAMIAAAFAAAEQTEVADLLVAMEADISGGLVHQHKKLIIRLILVPYLSRP